MTDRDLLVKALDEAQWELSEALKDLPDADTWRRPDPRLLSVGELAAHVGYWEAMSFVGEGFESPLVTAAASYYASSVGAPFEMSITGHAIGDEVKRIHEAMKAAFLAEGNELDGMNPYREGWTWGYTLRYQAFHVAYHAGQIYSVRHLLGHETADN